jgi:hypothetical protein
MTDTNVTVLRPFDEAQALDFLRAQPGGRTALAASEIARRGGWSRHKVTRALKRGTRDGPITRRGSNVFVRADGAHQGAQMAAQVPAQLGEECTSNGTGQPAAQCARRDRAVVREPNSGHLPENATEIQEREPRSACPISALETARSTNVLETGAQPQWQAIADPTPARGERHPAVARCAFLAALALATVSAGFSITGLTSIFVGAFWPVVAMGCALELGKLSAVAWLGRYSSGAGWRLKGCLVALVAVLMGLNAIGAYGFLAKAHIGHQVEGETAAAGRAADVDARIAVQVKVVSDFDRRIAQIDGIVEKATAKGRTGSAMALADQQRKTRGELAAQRVDAAKTLASLQVEKAGVEGQRAMVDADLGPVKYLATLIGVADEVVLRWFILVVAMLLDPAAVLLLYAAARAR